MPAGVTVGVTSPAANQDRAVDYDGVANSDASGYTEVVDAAWMEVTNFTVEAWIKPDVASGNHVIASRDAASQVTETHVNNRTRLP